MNIAGNNRPNGHWDVVPLPIENIAAQGQPQDLQNNYYDMAYPPVPPAVSRIYPWRIHLCP